MFAVLAIAQTGAQAEGRKPRPSLLLLKTSTPQQALSNYGPGASSSAAARSIKTPLEKLGLEFVSATGLTVKASQELDGGLPVSNESALDLARQAGAELVIVVGIEVKGEGSIRATTLVGHVAHLHLRVLDVASSAELSEARIQAPAYHQEPGHGAALAMTKAISEANTALAAKIGVRSSATSQNEALAISITGAQGWRSVASILRGLAATKGVEAVHLVSVQDSSVQLQVFSKQSAASLVGSLRRTRIHKGSLSVRSSNSSITVTVTPIATPVSFNG